MQRWPHSIDVPVETFLRSVGRVVRRFGDRADSRTTILGVETAEGRFVIKHAEDAEAVGWLESAIRFHLAVRHPSIGGVVAHFRTPDGLALVERWAPGEVLVDAFDPAVADRDEPGSPYNRFLTLSADEIARAIGQLLDAHVAVAAAGFVAVDLYDGCLVYNFDHRQVSLIDLDMYRPGPYVLDVDRQLGSRTYMAPEEWERGSTVDERTTVFTLGRFGQVLLGCERHGPAKHSDFRGSDRQFEILATATSLEPTHRFTSVADLQELWIDTLGRTQS